MTKEELIEEYIKWSGHPYKDLAYAFHSDLIAFAKHCLSKQSTTHKSSWTRENKESKIHYGMYETKVEQLNEALDTLKARDRTIEIFRHRAKEEEHFTECSRCGDFFDMRNLARVAAHEVCERLEPFKQGSEV